MNAPFRRGACPALSAPMPTGDGLLVRLSPAGTIALDALAGLCTEAHSHGNGIVEVTARGSIQVRGLTAASAPAFARAIGMLGIDGNGHVPVIADPLAGLAPTRHWTPTRSPRRCATHSLQHLGLRASILRSRSQSTPARRCISMRWPPTCGCARSLDAMALTSTLRSGAMLRLPFRSAGLSPSMQSRQ